MASISLILDELVVGFAELNHVDVLNMIAFNEKVIKPNVKCCRLKRCKIENLPLAAAESK